MSLSYRVMVTFMLWSSSANPENFKFFKFFDLFEENHNKNMTVTLEVHVRAMDPNPSRFFLISV
jgi:hypothetical protein